jgi:cystathionine beta-lyase
VEIPLERIENGRYEIDFDRFEEGIGREPTQFILCNPHNPTGRVFTDAELNRIAEICLRHQVLICSDEIHSDLIFSGNKHTPIASLSREIEKRTITFIAPSKTFNVAGLGCAIAIIPNADLRDQFSSEKDAFAGHVNVLGLTAALAAYRDSEDWVTSLLTYLEANRNMVTDFVCERLPGVKIYPVEGTYLAWLDCRSLELPSDPCGFFFQEAKVGLNNGADFGEPGKGFVRLNFGCPGTILHEALERMEQALTRRPVSGN